MAERQTGLLVALFIIGLIIGVAAGYLAAPKGGEEAAPTATTTITKTETKTETVTKTMGMQPQEITIKVETVGPDEPSFYRFENIKRAADKLNMLFEAAGIPIKVKVEGEFWTGSWEDYKRNILLAFQAGKGPDIILSGHEDIAPWSDAGYIIPLDDYINRWWNYSFLQDVIPTLWKSVTYKGKIWGIPQDTEARPLYFRKDLLKKLGWTDEDIQDFVDKAFKGQVTLEDIREICRQAVQAGVVDEGYCFWHRPKKGVDYFQLYLAYGGQLQDPETGKLVVDTAAYRKMFEFLYNLVHVDKALKSDLIGTDWKVIHETWVSGKLLFWMGGTWQKAEWIKKYNMSEEEFWTNIGYIPLPPGEEGYSPVTLSHPLVYMVGSQSEYPEIAFLLILLATNPIWNADHAVESGHLAIMWSELSVPKYKEDPWLVESAKLLQFSGFIPNHEKFGVYNEIIWKIMGGIESGELTPDEAVNYLVQQMQAQLGDDVIIK